MKRGGALKRTTPLRSGKPMKTATTSSPRTPLPKTGPRSERDRKDLDAMRDAVLARANGRCEWCGKKDALDNHHIVPRGRGVGWKLLNSPSNGAALCRYPCHERATADPLSIVDARGELGIRAQMVWAKFQAWRAGQ